MAGTGNDWVHVHVHVRTHTQCAHAHTDTRSLFPSLPHTHLYCLQTAQVEVEVLTDELKYSADKIFPS